MNGMRNNKKGKTILFDHHAEMFRYTDQMIGWKKHGTGNMQILNMDHSYEIQLLFYREEESRIFCRHIITRDTQFDEAQMSEAVLTWVGRDLLENRAKNEQWAVKFDNIDICQVFYNIILLSTAVSEKEQCEFPTQDSCIDQLLQFSTKESAEEFKQRCVNVRKATKVQSFLRNIQIWNDINFGLDITTESKRRYYQSLCQKMSQKASSETN